MTMIPLLLIGLGNPGSKYAANRHNVGFMVVDELRAKYGAGAEQRKFGGALSEASIGGKKALLFKPLSFMNHSGLPSVELTRFFKIPLENIIVFHDELDLPLAKIRVKTGGGHGGHNGLRSLDAHLGQEYKRVRIGIGHPGDKLLVSNYVLSDFPKEETTHIRALMSDISQHIDLLLQGDDAGFMNKLAPNEPRNSPTEKQE
ncbi:MAG: aminoacyl-tRNA hydrolase [Alphaproteobacteria bacterium]|nr:aminoacyl-tRNA hydrolase [Alphaproteobacteria bacterium]